MLGVVDCISLYISILEAFSSFTNSYMLQDVCCSLPLSFQVLAVLLQLTLFTPVNTFYCYSMLVSMLFLKHFKEFS